MDEAKHTLIALNGRLKHSDPVQFLKGVINDIEHGAYPGLEQIAIAVAFKGSKEELTYSYDCNGLRNDELFFLFELGKHALLHGEASRDDE